MTTNIETLLNLPAQVLAVCLPFMLACCDHGDEQDSTPEPAQILTIDSTRIECLLGNDNEVWAEDDSVCVVSLQPFSQNKYVLRHGAGTAEAEFCRQGSGHIATHVSGPLYALTAQQYAYSMSSTEDGKLQIATGVPAAYSLSEVGAADGGFRKPLPYWAVISSSPESGCLSASFRSLSALIRVPLSALPSGTRAVVLCTHRFVSLDEQKYYGGMETPLSGTFDAVLEESARLVHNPIFVSADSLRVNLETDARQSALDCMYIPVISGTYNKLYVIAVTSDDYRSYYWRGTILKEFDAHQDFSPGALIDLAAALQDNRP